MSARICRGEGDHPTGGEIPAERISNGVADGAVLTPGKLPWRGQGAVVD
jgi:hypothetical protein